MADLWNIISANYKTVGMTVPSSTPYVAVDPTLYEGSWTRKYADQKTFKITGVEVDEPFSAKWKAADDSGSRYVLEFTVNASEAKTYQTRAIVSTDSARYPKIEIPISVVVQ